MKNHITILFLLLIIFPGFQVQSEPHHPSSNAKMLMDPMPAGNAAKDISVVDMNGVPRTLDDLKGKFVLVNFWATWCNPCKVEMPLLEKLHQTLVSDKFTVLGLHVGPGPENIEEFRKLMPISFPIYIDMELEVDWGVPGLPTTFLLNPDGRLIYRAVGKREFASDSMINFLKNQIDSYDFAQNDSNKLVSQ